MNQGRNKPKLLIFTPFSAICPAFTMVACLFFGPEALAAGKSPETVSEIVVSPPKTLEDLEFRDKNGEAKKLSDFPGDVKIINFWALWCFPCKQEMPSLSKLQAEYAGRGLKIIPLANSTDGIRQIESFYKKNHISALDIFIDENNQNFKALALKGLPTSIIVNKNGEEVARVSGYSDWESKKTKAFIEKLLAE